MKEQVAVTGGSYVTARRQYAARMLPVPAYRLGRLIMAGEPLTGAVVYARISLDRQVTQATVWVTGQRLAVDQVVTEVGSALDGHRKKLLALLRVTAVLTIVVENRDRFARFGAEHIEAAPTGRLALASRWL